MNRHVILKSCGISAKVMLLFGAGCLVALNARCMIRHSPLAPAPTDAVLIEATYSSVPPQKRINRVRISVTVGEIVNCSEFNGIGGPFPCRKDGAVIYIHDCMYDEYEPPTAEVVCQFPETSFGSNMLVSYSAEAFEMAGGGERRAYSDPEITFFQGNLWIKPEKWNGIVHIPIMWKRGNSIAEMIDVAFFRDRDLGAFFQDRLNRMLGGVFFGNDPYSGIYSAARSVFNLWMVRGQVNASMGCELKFIDPPPSFMDGNIIVQAEGISDCSLIGLGAKGTVSIGGNGSYSSSYHFAHESGHFLHGQGDEYCAGRNSVVGDCVNIFGSLQKCRQYAVDNELPPESCRKACDGRFARMVQLDEGGEEEKPAIMRHKKHAAGWYLAVKQCVDRRVAACFGGLCYP